MKKYKINPDRYGNGLIERISYASTREIKFLLQYLMNLNESKFDGDTSVICLIADLKTVLGIYPNSNMKVLSEKQKDIVIRHLINNEPQRKIAEDYGITQQGVSIVLNTALKKIQKFLAEGEVSRIPWTEREKQYLLENFNKMSIEELEEALNIPANRIVSMYYYLKNKS